MNFQRRVLGWANHCFPNRTIFNKKERNLRFIEEALELVQSLDLSKEDVLKLVNYVYSRDKGHYFQEVGGVLITLSVLASVNSIELDFAGETELERIYGKVEEIREKQKFKEGNGITG